MAAFDKIKNLLKSPVVQIIAAIVLLAALILIAVWFGLLAALLHSRWLLEILAALAAVLVFAIVFWGIPWFREYRFLHLETAAHRLSGEDSPEEFHDQFLSALGRIKAFPHGRHEEPLYALPWYLVIGSSQSGKTAALAAADELSSLMVVPKEGGTLNCDWWISNAMVALDTAGRYALQPDAKRDRTDWYRLLGLIRHYHKREPISGLIVTVAADELLAGPSEQLTAEALAIRLRIEEAIQVLDVNVPLYLLITKCDRIEGFSEFFNVLPPRILNEAIGWVDESLPGAAERGQQRDTSDALGRFEAGVHSIYERLDFLRLSILNGRAPEPISPAIFCFPEEFRALESPLRTFAQRLLSRDVKYHTPMFRGVFFVSARQEGTPLSSLRQQLGISAQPTPYDGKTHRHYFLHDLFNAVLPRDRALAAAAAPLKKST